MCYRSVREKFCKQLQVYLFLKFYCSGKTILNANLLHDIAAALGYKSIRTVNSHINDLIEKNWVGYNPESGYLFIRGFDKIRQMDNMPPRSAVIFYYNDLKQISPCCFAGIIGYLVNTQRRDRFLSGRKRGGSNHLRSLSQAYFPIANKALAKILNFSIASIVRYKHLAVQHGYISVKKSYQKTGITSKNQKELRSYLAGLRRAFPEDSKSIKIKGSELVQQKPDLYKHNLTYKRRKKIEPYKRGYIRRLINK